MSENVQQEEISFPEEAKTDWFPNSVKPARPGWYEAKYNLAAPVVMLQWTGEMWMRKSSVTPGIMFRTMFNAFSAPNGQWRGLKDEYAPKTTM